MGLLSCKKTILLLAVIVASLLFFAGDSRALLIPNRTLSLTNVTPSEPTPHTTSFNFPSTNSVGSIVFEYCTSPIEDVACVGPAGLDASGASLSSQIGETGFSILSQNANRIIISRVPSVTGIQLNSYTFDDVVNPSGIGTFYQRISSYGSVDGTGPKLDFGATAAALTRGVGITTEVPPILDFCVGVRITLLCDSAEGSFLNLGTLSHTYTAVGTTQFSAATNASFGYVIRVFGNTLTSGNNAITALAVPTPSQIGTRQFGLNLRANTVPSLGADPVGGFGVAEGDYNIPNSYTYKSGDIIASTPFISTFQTFTVSYIVNVVEFQAPGIYNTTLTYVCTATF